MESRYKIPVSISDDVRVCFIILFAFPITSSSSIRDVGNYLDNNNSHSMSGGFSKETSLSFSDLAFNVSPNSGLKTSRSSNTLQVSNVYEFYFIKCNQFHFLFFLQFRSTAFNSPPVFDFKREIFVSENTPVGM